jgi:hypothetical protein
MGWNVDGTSKPGILHLRLEGRISITEMRAFVIAHNKAIDAFGGADYRVFCDIRMLSPLGPESAEEMQRAKEYSSAHSNFQGSGVWVENATAALQHRRTSQEGGVISTEEFSEDEAALWHHLSRVRRH